jgi:hypothetical protein
VLERFNTSLRMPGVFAYSEGRKEGEPLQPGSMCSSDELHKAIQSKDRELKAGSTKKCGIRSGSINYHLLRMKRW